MKAHQKDGQGTNLTLKNYASVVWIEYLHTSPFHHPTTSRWLFLYCGIIMTYGDTDITSPCEFTMKLQITFLLIRGSQPSTFTFIINPHHPIVMDIIRKPTYNQKMTWSITSLARSGQITFKKVLQHNLDMMDLKSVHQHGETSSNNKERSVSNKFFIANAFGVPKYKDFTLMRSIKIFHSVHVFRPVLDRM